MRRALKLVAAAAMGGGFDQGLAFAQPLVKAGYTVVAPSRFGYLRTPMPTDASAEAQARAYVCLLDYSARCVSMILVVPAIGPEDSKGMPAPPSRLARAAIETTLRSDAMFWMATHAARDTTTANDGFGTAAGSRLASKRLRNARLVIFPDGGHTWVGHQIQMWEVIGRFLEKRAPDS